MKRKLLLGACAASVGLILAGHSAVQAQGIGRAAQYDFGARRHVDDLANRLMQEANEICWEMYRNYRGNPDFSVTYREMYQVMQAAHHVHDLVHDDYHVAHNESDHIARDLHEIDKLFHHIEDDVRHWRPTYHRRGHFGLHGFGHRDFGHDVHGPGYGDSLSRKMRQFEQTLHHLMADYGVRSQLENPAVGAPLAPGAPPAPDADLGRRSRWGRSIWLN